MGDGPTVTGGTKAILVDRSNFDDKTMHKGDMTTPPSKSSFVTKGFEFFKETMSGLKGKSFAEKIQFIGERIELRKEQKASFKEAVADYNLSLEKKAYMGSLDRKDAEVAGKEPPKLNTAQASNWLVLDKYGMLGEKVSTLMGSFLQDAETMIGDIIKEETTGKNEGKTFTREQAREKAFNKIADSLVLTSTAGDFEDADLKSLNLIAKGLDGEGRKDKAQLLKVIIERFADARKPENAVRLFKDIALEHSKNAGEQSFLRAAGGKDGITQKYLAFGSKANELYESSAPIWTATKNKDDYKTLENDLRGIIEKAVDEKSTASFNMASVYPRLSEGGKLALGNLVKEFVADLKKNGLPEPLKKSVQELQSKIIEGNVDVGSKVSSLFVSTLLKNSTPVITDNPGLHEGKSPPKTEKKETVTREEQIKKVVVNDKLVSTLSSLLSGVLTGCVNGGIADAKINHMALADLQKDVLIPLGREISELFKNAGMSVEGLKARADLIDRHANFIEKGNHLKMIASYSPPPPEKTGVDNK